MRPPADDQPRDLISTREAAGLVPSPRGSRTHLSTVLRWVLTGKVRGWRRGKWWFVSKAEVLALLVPVDPAAPPAPARVKTVKEKDAEARALWVRRVLENAGIR